MKYLLLIFTFFLLAGNVFCQPFITTWNIIGNQLVIPGTGTNYNISWVEVGNPSNNGTATGTNTASLFIPKNGIYQVSVSGGSPAFNRINFNGSTNAVKLLSINQWGNIHWSSMLTAFMGCKNLIYNAADAPDLSGVTDLSYMFSDCWVFNGNISNWNTANITNMSYMFFDAYAFNQPIDNWNTANVINMASMFSTALAFNQSLDNWNTGNVTDMNYMFSYASKFNQPINSWNVSKVTNMALMFNQSISFNQPLKSWNTGNVTNMVRMFYYSPFNQPIDNWNTGNVTNMSEMFGVDTMFNQPIGNWNTSNVTDMSGMFETALAFNQPINNWNTSNVITMNSMFKSSSQLGGIPIGHPVFNQTLKAWNTSKVADMSYMFSNCSSFDQSLDKWDISSVADMSNMLSLSGLNVIHYDSTLIGWDSKIVKNDIQLGSIGLYYCNSQLQRQDLLSTHGWTINGDNLNCILPLKIISFIVTQDNNSCLLQWKTSNEVNTSYFEIERSGNAINFSAIGIVKSKNNLSSDNNYYFTDTLPTNGNYFYRLKEVGLDGNYNYSEIIFLHSMKEFPLQIYPNPAHNYFNVIVPLSSQQSSISIYNSENKLLFRQLLNSNSTQTKIDISNLTKGLYIVILKIDSQRRAIKLLKN